MNISTLFNDITILQEYNVSINDQQLINEEVISLEIKWSFSSFPVNGTLSIKDSGDLANQKMFAENSKIKVYARDIHGQKFLRKFIITKVSNSIYNGRFKQYTLEFIDEIFYKLHNTYLSKGFSGTIDSSFNKCLEYLQLDSVIEESKLIKYFDTLDTVDFIIPQDRNIFEYFSELFRREGIRFWQTRKGLYLKKFDFNKLDKIMVDGKTALYTNSTTNQNYLFKIHEFKTSYNNLLELNTLKPISKQYTFNIDTKKMDIETLNLKDIYDTLATNDGDMSWLQQTTGEMYNTNSEIFLGEQKLNIEDIFLKNNITEIIVPGNLKYSEVGKLIQVSFKGNPISAKSDLEGDIFHSGIYFVESITDRYIGDKMIQKFTLCKIDSRKVRKI